MTFGQVNQSSKNAATSLTTKFRLKVQTTKMIILMIFVSVSLYKVAFAT